MGSFAGMGSRQPYGRTAQPATPAIPTFQQMFGGTAQQTTAPTPPAPQPATIKNTAQISPYLKKQLERYDQRFDVDNTKRAIDKSTLGTMDAAALGARDLGAANLARRGASGTGVGGAFLAKRFYEPAQRQAAGNAADITMQRERDLDALVLGGTALARSPDDISLSNRDLNLRQALGYEDVGLRKSAQEQSRIDQQMAQYMAMLQMLTP